MGESAKGAYTMLCSKCGGLVGPTTDPHLCSRLDSIEQNQRDLWTAVGQIRDHVQQIAINTSDQPRLKQQVDAHEKAISALQQMEASRSGAWWLAGLMGGIVVSAGSLILSAFKLVVDWFKA